MTASNSCLGHLLTGWSTKPQQIAIYLGRRLTFSLPCACALPMKHVVPWIGHPQSKGGEVPILTYVFHKWNSPRLQLIMIVLIGIQIVASEKGCK